MSHRDWEMLHRMAMDGGNPGFPAPWFRVYELVDPRDDAVFYVGAAVFHKLRLRQHCTEARRGKSGAKCERIRTILADGLKVDQRVIGLFSTQAAALVFEAQQIKERGAALTNVQRPT